MFCGISECIYCLTSVSVTIMTSSHKLALGLPTKLAPYRSDTVYLAMIATTLSQYEYVLICDKSNIRVSGSPHVSRILTSAINGKEDITSSDPFLKIYNTY
ncbi:hypothetical protein PHYBLDRAFT_171001 [Phycomyces blakesleeanus NRRL 1555(-)]|uniref:Uncharacterized protein n=1 Tax=Phycomyces blakesleeanus (strain ATCC 8743b / DSM 1359 / FGSC 10004 / NBRC 33097 / NRRL 1555) TaxID=763407 RepID=A0A162TYV4_PHYB8|nr:hypothetical protein PHYBLDRAFT_171001 [Phycomyces blakesleeanus NRRL 1555(-)]OAD70923.1 hypothetical protein PHYBLDRAFT_171001 [Phycomyces blakesleeanus NRRL 1555(-)]|eukprot:XP_018288963.1 hypothetical protein PHYBLDRAFT_171001 [Phycomyces blakesleeanus NRRL 1555(-)]